MAKKPKALENVSNRVILIGSVATALIGIVSAWVMFGGAIPITKHSPVVEALHEVDRDYGDKFQIQELEVEQFKAEIKRIDTTRIENSLESDGFLVTQYDRPNLTDGERFERDRLLRRIEKHKRELDRLDKK